MAAARKTKPRWATPPSKTAWSRARAAARPMGAAECERVALGVIQSLMTAGWADDREIVRYLLASHHTGFTAIQELHDTADGRRRWLDRLLAHSRDRVATRQAPDAARTRARQAVRTLTRQAPADSAPRGLASARMLALILAGRNLRGEADAQRIGGGYASVLLGCGGTATIRRATTAPKASDRWLNVTQPGRAGGHAPRLAPNGTATPAINSILRTPRHATLIDELAAGRHDTLMAGLIATAEHPTWSYAGLAPQGAGHLAHWAVTVSATRVDAAHPSLAAASMSKVTRLPVQTCRAALRAAERIGLLTRDPGRGGAGRWQLAVHNAAQLLDALQNFSTAHGCSDRKKAATAAWQAKTAEQTERTTQWAAGRTAAITAIGNIEPLVDPAELAAWIDALAHATTTTTEPGTQPASWTAGARATIKKHLQHHQWPDELAGAACERYASRIKAALAAVAV